MDNFVVSARKYRPVTFTSVVGQSSITNTLKNAIKNNHIAHAYLFCGPRGVGKTTCARIFAKTLNCTNLNSNLEPCNECESCLSLTESRSYNIHELDAASNNGVDDIRSLNDLVRIPPQIGKFSVYIIDEVHMLSQGAFNAFLKTLEEPPAHAIFILATTEKHKIIPTILSRCQIFDFNRITVEDISSHLNFVAKSEGVIAEQEGLHVIAQKADGALRDALSIFDQIVSFSGNNITYKDVINNLNILDYEYFQKLLTAFISNDISSSLLIFDEILSDGFDAQNFIAGLSDYFRDLIVCKSPATIKLLEVAPSLKEVYKTQSEQCDLYFLYQALNILNYCDINYKASNNKRLLVELTLIKLCRVLEEKKNNDLKQSSESKSVTNQPISRQVTEGKENKEVTNEITVTPTNVTQPEKKYTSENAKNVVKKADVSFSIKDHLSKPEQSKEESIVEEDKVEIVRNKNEFSEIQLIDAWNTLAENYKEKESRTFNTLTSNLPTINADKQIQLILTNKLQEEIVLKNKTDIVVFLRKELKNDLVDFETIVNEENDGNKKIIYTDTEKFNFLKEINPELNDLKDQFKLDFK